MSKRRRERTVQRVSGALVVLVLIILLVAVAGCTTNVQERERDEPASPGPPHLAITNGRIFDATGTPVIENSTVLVRDNQIVAVGRAEEVDLPRNVEIIDAGGGLIMPGVIDNHMHAFWPNSPLTTLGDDTMTPWLRAGVTTLVDTASIRHTARAGRALVDSMEHPPRFFLAGPMITVPGGYPTTRREFDIHMYAWTIQGADDAYAVVADLIDTEGVDLIKVAIETGFDTDYDFTGGWPTLSMEELRAIVAAAHERGKMVRAHVINPGEALAAVRAGLDVLAHTPSTRSPTRFSTKRPPPASSS